MLKLLTKHGGDRTVSVPQQEPTIALLTWGHVWEDFLDSIGVSLETFCKEGQGGWMLGYIDSLAVLVYEPY
jgi:hypothetical protein